MDFRLKEMSHRGDSVMSSGKMSNFDSQMKPQSANLSTNRSKRVAISNFVGKKSIQKQGKVDVK